MLSLLHDRPAARPLPHPLVRFSEHPTRWLYNKAILLAAVVILAYVGQFVFTGLYYLVFEVNPTLNHWWHTAVPNSDLRHSFRNHGEGLFGGLFGVAAVWNHYRRARPLNRIDKLEIKLHIANVKDTKTLSGFQFVSLLVLVPLYAIPGYFATQGLVYLIHHVPLIWSHVHQFWILDMDQKLVGYGAAFFFGRRPAKAVFDDLQLWLAQRIVALPGPVYDYWWMLPTLRARCNDLRSTKGTDLEEYRSVRWRLGIGLIVTTVVCLFGLGLYVMLFVA